MTTRPTLETEVNWVNGLAAVALFAVMASVFMTAGFPRPDGFGDGSITASIGYAMFDLLGQIPEGHGETEGFLVAFIVIAVVLDAALDGAVMLARREDEDGDVVTALTDGGRRFVGGSTGRSEGDSSGRSEGDSSGRSETGSDGAGSTETPSGSGTDAGGEN
jgi:NADH-quinone oxidoreductase subunit J